MLANARRGEVMAKLDGKDYRLCLTLGGLAELETALGADDLVTLGERFSTGRLSARDMIAVIAAGLRGAGHALDESDVAAMQVSGGLADYAKIVADLLLATFGAGGEADAANP
jgi:Phage tail tube protein, GTA-gp10